MPLDVEGHRFSRHLDEAACSRIHKMGNGGAKHVGETMSPVSPVSPMSPVVHLPSPDGMNSRPPGCNMLELTAKEPVGHPRRHICKVKGSGVSMEGDGEDSGGIGVRAAVEVCRVR